VVDSHIEVGNRLCLNALRCIYHQQRSLTSRNAPADFVAEVNMSRSVNEVESVSLAIAHIFHLDGMAFDGNATLTLEVHVIEHLTFCYLDGVCPFEETVGQCALAMVYMGYDTKVTNMFHGCKDSDILCIRQGFVDFF
jgi:hypothetical protein